MSSPSKKDIDEAIRVIDMVRQEAMYDAKGYGFNDDWKTFNEKNEAVDNSVFKLENRELYF